MDGKRILLLLGGNYHDFDGFAGAIKPPFEASGHSVGATYDPDALLRLDENQVEVVMLYTCLGGGRQGDNIAEDLNAAQTEALVNWVREGGGLLAAHAATVVGEANSELRRLLGGAFVSHPPQFSFTVYPMWRPTMRPLIFTWSLLIGVCATRWSGASLRARGVWPISPWATDPASGNCRPINS